MIRVWLSSIRSNMTYNLTIAGTYTVAGQTLTSGSAVTVEFSGGTVYMTAGGVRTPMGTSVTLGRQSGGVRIAQSLSPANTYPGDMRFFYSGGTAYVVCTLYIEDYLYGVLPYEMSNSFPLEALKAQAVAARTFAAFSKKSSGSYDVTDTVSYQVFRGVDTTKTRCIQAVNETKGQVLKYGGAYIEASFGASNGGQTETRYNAWGSTKVAYQQIKDDPYDLANTASIVKSYMLYDTPSKGSSTAGYNMIQDALAQSYGGISSNYTINEITDVTMHTPKYASPSRVYTRMRVSVRYNGSASATVDIPIFSTVKTALGLKINGTDNELVSVTREANGFRIYARRYGHGIGLSQRGAQQMANNGMAYRDIVGFYYEGAQLTQETFTSNWSGGSAAIPEPSQEPQVIDSDTTAIVTLSNPGDFLNLRQGPSTGTAVIGLLPNGATVTITGTSGSWYAVRYGNLTGYVAGQYLTISQGGATQTPAPGTTTGDTNAIVTVQSGMLNLRSGEGTHTAIVGRIPAGARLTVIQRGDIWSSVRYGSLTGYVMTQYLTMLEEPAATDTTSPEPTTSPTLPPTSANEEATVKLANTLETLNLRQGPSINTAVLTQLRHGTVLQVLERDTIWSKVTVNGITGYVMNAFVAFAGASVGTPTQTEAPQTGTSVNQAQRATVSVPSGTLNLRREPSLASSVIASIPNRAQVTVTNMNDVWCAVRYGYLEGFVMRTYLIVDGAALAPVDVPDPGSSNGTGTDGLRGIVTVQAGVLNLRSRPTKSAEVLAGIPNGAQVQINNMNDVWCAVRYQGTQGFVMRMYLTIDGQVASQVQQTAAGAEAAVAESSRRETPALTEANPLRVTSGVVSVATGELNLRSLPSEGAAVVASIPDQTEVQVLNMNELWCAVRYEEQEGYVMRAFVLLEGEAEAQPEPTASAAEEAWIATQNGGSVNIRQEPSAESDIVGTAPHGARVERMADDGAWSQIAYQGIEGFVASSFVTKDAPQKNVEETAPEVTSEPKQTAYIQSTNGGVNLRQSPSLEAEVLASLPHGTALMLIDSDAEWAQVRYEDMEGYVRMEFMTTDAPEEPVPEVTQAPQVTATPVPMATAGTAINRGVVDMPEGSALLRREADEDAEMVASLADGTEVEVLRYAGDDAQWLYVRSDVAAGYAWRSDVSLDNRIAFVVLEDGSGSLNVRASASAEAEVVGSVRHDAAVTVLGTEDGWAKVRLEGGTTGYVMASYLSYANG